MILVKYMLYKFKYLYMYSWPRSSDICTYWYFCVYTYGLLKMGTKVPALWLLNRAKSSTGSRCAVPLLYALLSRLSSSVLVNYCIILFIDCILQPGPADPRHRGRELRHCKAQRNCSRHRQSPPGFVAQIFRQPLLQGTGHIFLSFMYNLCFF
jgi:hypothetical protein